MLNDAGTDDESDTSEQAHPGTGKDWKGKGTGKSKILVTENIERQLKSVVNFSLIICGLRAQAENLCAERANPGIIVPEATWLAGFEAQARPDQLVVMFDPKLMNAGILYSLLMPVFASWPPRPTRATSSCPA